MQYRGKKKLHIYIYLIGAIFLLIGSYLEIKSEISLNKATAEYNSLFTNNQPKKNVTIKQVKATKSKVKNIKNYQKQKKTMLTDLLQYEKYLNLKTSILSGYNGKNIKSSITDKKINNYQKSAKSLDKKYQTSLNSYLKDMKKQKKEIDAIEKSVLKLFKDNNTDEINEKTTQEDIEKVKKKVQTISQQDIKERNLELITKATTLYEERQELIKVNWIKLNVPYISQNKNNVLNGCEAASLLMGLQYKGFLLETNIVDFATNMPKSTDPNEGFTYDIFTLEPKDVPHWIAPNALSKYGRDSSGHPNVVDGTGMTLEQLDNELDHNNPVVIYATGKFEEPKEFIEGAPKNVHVLLLTGYNKVSKQQFITDPWTHKDGRTTWTLDKEELEKIYNAVGKKNVIIRT